MCIRYIKKCRAQIGHLVSTWRLTNWKKIFQKISIMFLALRYDIKVVCLLYQSRFYHLPLPKSQASLNSSVAGYVVFAVVFVEICTMRWLPKCSLFLEF